VEASEAGVLVLPSVDGQGELVLARLQDPLGFPRFAQEVDAHQVRACLDGNAYLEALVGMVCPRLPFRAAKDIALATLRGRRARRTPAELELLDARPVEAQLEFVRLVQAAQVPDVVGLQVNPDDVFRVDGELMANGEAAA